MEMTEAYWKPKIAKAKMAKAFARRIADDAMFEKGWPLVCKSQKRNRH